MKSFYKDFSCLTSFALLIFFIVYVGYSHASVMEDLVIYHGIDFHKCEGHFRSNISPGSAKAEGVALNPFMGVRINDLVSLHIAYFHMDSGRKRFISKNTVQYAGATYQISTVKLLRHKMIGQHIDVVVRTPELGKSHTRFFVSAGLMPAKIKASVEAADIDEPLSVSPMSQRYNFFRFGVGALFYIADNVAVRGSFTFLKPKHITLSPHRQTADTSINSLVQKFRNSTHVGIGVQYEWR
jgi:hypothetical protein